MGLSEEKVQKIHDYSNSDLSEREKAALRLTEIIASDPHTLDDKFIAELKKYFSDEQLLDLGVAIGLLNGLHRFLETFGVLPESYEEGTACEVPQRA
jgi:alkylhydroperoxidase family enzyme